MENLLTVPAFLNRTRQAVEATRIINEEAKSTNPSIEVLGSAWKWLQASVAFVWENSGLNSPTLMEEMANEHLTRCWVLFTWWADNHLKAGWDPPAPLTVQGIVRSPEYPRYLVELRLGTHLTRDLMLPAKTHTPDPRNNMAASVPLQIPMASAVVTELCAADRELLGDVRGLLRTSMDVLLETLRVLGRNTPRKPKGEPEEQLGLFGDDKTKQSAQESAAADGKTLLEDVAEDVSGYPQEGSAWWTAATDAGMPNTLKVFGMPHTLRGDIRTGAPKMMASGSALAAHYGLHGEHRNSFKGQMASITKILHLNVIREEREPVILPGTNVKKPWSRNNYHRVAHLPMIHAALMLMGGNKEAKAARAMRADRAKYPGIEYLARDLMDMVVTHRKQRKSKKQQA